MKTIGILTQHGEQIVPQSSHYKLFFQALTNQGWKASLQAPGEAFSYQALLCGAPTKGFSNEEAEALRGWVESGGHLLGVSAPSTGKEPMHNPFGALAPVLEDSYGFSEKHYLSIEKLFERYDRLEYQTSKVFTYHGERALILSSLEASAGKYAFLQIQLGKGRLSLLASEQCLRDTALDDVNVRFLLWLLQTWLPECALQELEERQARPQRHRLLHGYPMLPLMRNYKNMDWHSYDPIESLIRPSNERGAVLGVLPHPFCNPTVRGCGFCTFPQQSYSTPKSEELVQSVIKEIKGYFVGDLWSLHKRAIHALYLGGGTANLTPPNAMRDLCKTLRESFDLRRAEVTLEGVPIYFIAKKPSLLDVLREELPAENYRISMGLQTFDKAQLSRMGREHFGDSFTFQEVANTAHQKGFTVSGDLLFNLPGQSLEQMKEDVKRAIELGLEQICIYHLVMFDGLGTEWSKDPKLLRELPLNARACANWLSLREMLLDHGFVQTTLTNFEKREVNLSRKRFRYEVDGFKIEHYDLIGFGPSGITMVFDPEMQFGVKLTNPEGAEEYKKADPRRPWERFFGMAKQDVKTLYLTRKVSSLGFSQSLYRRLFGSDFSRDFSFELEAFLAKGLVEIRGDRIQLTPTGMFYGDSIAGLLASRQVSFLKLKELIYQRTPDTNWIGHSRDVNDALYLPMG